jgi:hypothetical protein
MSGSMRAVADGGDFEVLLAALLRNGKVSGLHTFLVARGGDLLFERYWEGAPAPEEAKLM